MKLKDVMTRKVCTSTPDSSIREVAEQMKKLNVGAIPVLEGDRPIGIITDRDIVLRTISENKDPFNTKASEIMSQDLVFGTPDMDADDAAALMSRYQIRRLPIVDNNRLIGIVALGDLAATPYLVDEAGDTLSNISHPIGPDIQ